MARNLKVKKIRDVDSLATQCMPLLHGKCTYSSRICEAFTTLSATDEQDFVALLVALVSGWVEPCHESEANDAHLLFLSFFMSCVLSGKSKII